MNMLGTSSSRKALFALLYLSEGAPIGFLWWALPAMFRASGMALETITGLTSLLVLPWALKFLWAPCVDALRSATWTFRSWILSCQLVMGVSLLPLLFLDVPNDFSLVVFFLIVHAFAAATQDASIDALCIAETPKDERGKMNGWMQAGMLFGRSAFGGGTLLLLSLDRRLFLIALVLTIWIPGILLFFSKESGRERSPRHVAERWRSVFESIRNLTKTKLLWLSLLFGSMAGTGYEAVGAVAGPFLIDRGFSASEVGYFYSFLSVPSMILGALVGGYLSDRMERKRSVSMFLMIMAACIFLLSATDMLHGSRRTEWMMFLLASLYAGIGLFTASSYALFMDITRKDLGATQFSALMGTTNLCESASAFSIGKLIPAAGYALSFTGFAVLSLLSLPVLRLITVPSSEQRRQGVENT
ncbi:MAG: MFS transporter [Ignavibacteriales bacterium]|nr:MFS transporter [Ignavibacteriales bacterium]